MAKSDVIIDADVLRRHPATHGSGESAYVCGPPADQVRRVLEGVAERCMLVDELGREHGSADEVPREEIYTPNYAGVHDSAAGPYLYVDCKGEIGDPMADTFSSILREELERGGIDSARVVAREEDALELRSTTKSARRARISPVPMDAVAVGSVAFTRELLELLPTMLPPGSGICAALRVEPQDDERALADRHPTERGPAFTGRPEKRNIRVAATQAAVAELATRYVSEPLDHLTDRVTQLICYVDDQVALSITSGQPEVRASSTLLDGHGLDSLRELHRRGTKLLIALPRRLVEGVASAQVQLYEYGRPVGDRLHAPLEAVELPWSGAHGHALIVVPWETQASAQADRWNCLRIDVAGDVIWEPHRIEVPVDAAPGTPVRVQVAYYAKQPEQGFRRHSATPTVDYEVLPGRMVAVEGPITHAHQLARITIDEQRSWVPAENSLDEPIDLRGCSSPAAMSHIAEKVTQAIEAARELDPGALKLAFEGIWFDRPVTEPFTIEQRAHTLSRTLGLLRCAHEHALKMRRNDLADQERGQELIPELTAYAVVWSSRRVRSLLGALAAILDGAPIAAAPTAYGAVSHAGLGPLADVVAQLHHEPLVQAIQGRDFELYPYDERASTIHWPTGIALGERRFTMEFATSSQMTVVEAEHRATNTRSLFSAIASSYLLVHKATRAMHQTRIVLPDGTTQQLRCVQRDRGYVVEPVTMR